MVIICLQSFDILNKTTVLLSALIVYLNITDVLSPARGHSEAAVEGRWDGGPAAVQRVPHRGSQQSLRQGQGEATGEKRVRTSNP